MNLLYEPGCSWLGKSNALAPHRCLVNKSRGTFPRATPSKQRPGLIASKQTIVYVTFGALVYRSDLAEIKGWVEVLRG